MAMLNNFNLILSNPFTKPTREATSLNIFIFTLISALSACSAGHHPTLADLQAPDPESRLAAIQLAAQTENPETIPDLIANLDSDDPAVRLMAIGTLRKLTGQSYHYRFDAPPDQRDRATTAWAEAWKNEAIPHTHSGTTQP